MDQGRILSGGAFRAASRATLFFGAFLCVAGFIAFFYVDREMTLALEDQIIADRQELLAIHENAGTPGLIAAMDAAGGPLGLRLRVFGLFDERGLRLAGNLVEPPATLGWQTTETRLAPSSDGAARVYLNASQVDGMALVVGRDIDLIALQERRMLGALVAFGLVVGSVYLLIGYLVSLQSLRKLDRMAATLERVSQGDTGARLGVSAQNDQLDRVSSAMNLHLDRLMTVTRTEATAIAHDLRTPLSRAWLRLGQAMADIEAGRDALGALADVEAELQRLGHIFDAILRISRLATAEDRSAFREVPVNRLLGEMQETFGPVAEERGQTLIARPARDALAVFTDPGMLSQLLANLVQNAITHCPPGATISIGAEQTGTRTILTVSDTGPGIAESDRGRVFDLFVRLDPQRTGSGTGIGLALVRALADRLSATVSLSDVGPGLRVEVAFDREIAPVAS